MQALMAQFESMGINPQTIFSQMSQVSGILGFNPLTGKANSSGSLVPLETIREIGRQFIAAQSQLPVGTVDLTQSAAALDLADLWLNDATIFPALTRHPSAAWSRREWLEASVEGWQKLVEPLANGMAAALTSIVEQSNGVDEVDPTQSEANSALGSLPSMLPILRSVMGTLFATQLGNSVGALALSVTGSNDVALPLFKSFNAHLIPQNAIGWGEGLDIPEDEIRIFLALRESAAARLFAHTPWLSEYIYDAVSSYASGIRIDIQTMQEQAESAMNTGELDLNNPQSIQIAINQGLFTPEATPKQEAALARLEIALALIEGWIDQLTTQAAGERLPSYAALSETLRRRRATSAPTQQLFSSLFGLEVSPRKSRECAKFWSDVKAIGGMELCDGRWEDPALLPNTDEVSDAKKFLESTTVPDDLSGLI
ncbi:MAG: hypothetical protein F2856_00520 [Actinobacteria bacterium]|nr:hypothetical protein [Actinomycetota bacterium]